LCCAVNISCEDGTLILRDWIIKIKFFNKPCLENRETEKDREREREIDRDRDRESIETKRETEKNLEEENK
jgi:hypothetical protein